MLHTYPEKYYEYYPLHCMFFL